MSGLDDLPPLRDVIARHGLAARKSLGQNFLMDLQLLDRIARVPGKLDGAAVYEVGPGPGGLTRALLKAARGSPPSSANDRALPALHDIAAAANGRLRIVGEDAMRIDERALLGEPAHIVSNLPYNIGTALLVRWLTAEPWPPWWPSLTLMFQKEVAQRIAAATGERRLWPAIGARSGGRGRRSRSTCRLGAFTPPPKVSSAVVHIVPTDPVRDVPVKAIEAVTAAAFGQRRKMLRASLKGLRGGVEALAACGIDSERRAETLSVAEFAALAAEIA